jgi:hypothetical protein
LFTFLVEVKAMAAEEIGTIMAQDYLRTGAQDLPASLKPFMSRQSKSLQSTKDRQSRVPARQERHSQVKLPAETSDLQ